MFQPILALRTYADCISTSKIMGRHLILKKLRDGGCDSTTSRVLFGPEVKEEEVGQYTCPKAVNVRNYKDA